LKYRKDTIELHYGYIVERHLMDGDIVLFNRQPTLHKMSMMGHRVKILHNKKLSSFSFSPCVCKPYNADFDGDEMNMFPPQSIQTRIELEELADVKFQLVSSRSSNALIGLVQDTLIGAYVLSSSYTSLSWKQVAYILSHTSFSKYDSIDKKKTYTGLDVVSLILPENMNMKKYNGKNLVFHIENSIIKQGYLNSSILGAKGTGNLTQYILEQTNPDTAIQFLNDIQRICIQFNLLNGFTIGIGDLLIDDKINEQISANIETKQLEVDVKITEHHNNINLVDMNVFEKNLYDELNNNRDDIGNIVMSNIHDRNNCKIMITSGARGAQVNIAQMSGIVGQQVLGGKRMPVKLNNRSQPYFTKYDIRAVSRGYIDSSYIKGMKWYDSIFHQSSGREGLIDTAIKTAETGYQERRLVKMSENAVVKYDGTVRVANNVIIQFVYGGSNFDTIKQSDNKLLLVEMTNAQIEQEFSYEKSSSNAEFIQNLIQLRDNIRMSHFQSQISTSRDFSTNCWMPFNMSRIIENAKMMKSNSSKRISSPEYVMNKLNDLVHPKHIQFINMSQNEILSNNFKYKNDDISKTTFKAVIYSYLAPKKIISEYQFNDEQFSYVLNEIRNKLNTGFVQPGEMVGIIASQSISEPLTQMTLNTFHFSGVAAVGTTTLGVPRVKELLSASKNIKTPHMYIHLEKKHISNKSIANKIKSYLTSTLLGDLKQEIEIIYDPDPDSSDSYTVKDNVKNLFKSNYSTKYSCSDNIYLPWLIRIQFDKNKFLNKDIQLIDIVTSFCNYWEKMKYDMKAVKKQDKHILDKIIECSVMSNTDTHDVPILHIRFDISEYDELALIQFTENIVEQVRINGVNHITEVNFQENKHLELNADGSVKVMPNFTIHTLGINFVEIYNMKYIDSQKTYCNDIHVIYEKFGIEAARAVLLNEIINAFEKNDSFINYHHLNLLVDIMTNNGFITSIDRFGMSRLDLDPLSRASFERTIDHLVNASVFKDVDSMNSVSSRIIAGLVVKAGTGMCNLLLDHEMIEKSEFTEDISQLYNKTYNEITNQNILNDIVEKSETDVFIPL
jgi:DNA-directed RNA polymerase II subunit RPB1